MDLGRIWNSSMKSPYPFSVCSGRRFLSEFAHNARMSKMNDMEKV